jgi:hypothetical protein
MAMTSWPFAIAKLATLVAVVSSGVLAEEDWPNSAGIAIYCGPSPRLIAAEAGLAVGGERRVTESVPQEVERRRKATTTMTRMQVGRTQSA